MTFQFDSILIKKIYNYCEETLGKWRVPGAAVAIVAEGEVKLLKGFGYSNLQDQTCVTEDTLFPIASLTKAFASASVAILVDKGLLKWTDRVIDYLPDFKMYDPWVTKEFQIVDLFCHRSGLSAHSLEQLENWGYGKQELKRAQAYTVPETSFRSTYAYHNVPYLWVEDLIEKITGDIWENFLKDNIFEPLKMNRSFVNSRNAKIYPFISGHILDEESRTKVQAIPFSGVTDTYATAGGMISNISDLSKWMLMQLGKNSLISDENIQYMRTPKMHIEDALFTAVGWRMNYKRPYRTVQHGGLIQGIKHLMVLIPDLNCGIVILTNLTQSEAPLSITEYFCDTVMGIEALDYNEKLFFQTEFIPRPSPKTKGLSTENLKKYEGGYENVILGKIKITIKDDHLLMTLGPKNAQAELKCIQDNDFSIYFLGMAGADYGEGHWGNAIFSDNQLILKGNESFEEEFILERI